MGPVRGQGRHELTSRRLAGPIVPGDRPGEFRDAGREARLILRATDLLAGRPGQAATGVAILLYAGHNAAACVAAWWGGRVVDRVGAGPVLAIGALLYAVAYLGLAAGPVGWPALLALFLLAGTGIGVAEPAESTLVARRLGEELRAAGFGVLGLVQSAGDLVATVVAGVLWSALSAGAAFCWAAGWMLLSVLAGGLAQVCSRQRR